MDEAVSGGPTAAHKVVRRLAAVVCVDVVGYSHLAEVDEECTIRRLKGYWDRLVRPDVEDHGGRIVKLMGDGALIEFPSVVEAVRSALAIQSGFAGQEADAPEALRLRLRIGLHLGDIVIDGDDIQGHGVNIAARLQTLAEPGGICISEAVRSVVGKSLPLSFRDLGEQAVKNIAEPVRAYAVLASGQVSGAALRSEPVRSSPRRLATAGIGLLLAAGAVAAAIYLYRVPGGSPDVSEQVTMPATPTAAPVSTPSVAVLPFANLSDNDEQAFFVDGLTEDLIIDLSKLPGLFVISRDTAFTYKGQSVQAGQIATDLGVQYVLTGSVQRAADKVRVNAYLIDGTNDRQLWAESYDRELSDIFAVQDDLKQRIVEALALQLSAGERAQLSGAPTGNIEAYEYYLRGRHAMNLLTRRSLRMAYWSFEKATELDPDFAEAYAALSMTYAKDLAGTQLGWNDWVRPPARARTLAPILAAKSASLKPALAMPELALARLSLADREYDQALLHADRALALEPGNSEAYATQAFVLTAVGRHEEALRAIAEALRRDPKGSAYVHGTMGMIQFALRNYEKAVSSLATSYEELTDGGDWSQASLWAAANGYLHPLNPADEYRKYRKTDVRVTLAGTRFVQFYQRAEDTEHLLEGLRRAGAPEYTYGLDPATDAGERVDGKALEDLLSGHSFDALSLDPRLYSAFHFSPSGQTTWVLRHDISASGTSRIIDDRLCVVLPSITGNRESCYSVYRSRPDTEFGRNYHFVLFGPSVWYFTEGPDSRAGP